jgi:hypothetical protein
LKQEIVNSKLDKGNKLLDFVNESFINYKEHRKGHFFT